MHSIRSHDDERGNTLRPSAEALELQQGIHLFGIESIFRQTEKTPSPEWTKVITDPGLFCRDGLT